MKFVLKTMFGLALGLWLFTSAQAQQVRVIKFHELQKLTNQPTDTTYIVNFWATWCRPCVAEIPSFEKLHTNYRHKKLKILLVSMDFAKDLSSRVIPFVTKNHLKSSLFLLNETDYNLFIDQIDPTWTGAIPATLIVNNRKHKRKFFEKELNYELLVREIQPLL